MWRNVGGVEIEKERAREREWRRGGRQGRRNRRGKVREKWKGMRRGKIWVGGAEGRGKEK